MQIIRNSGSRSILALAVAAALFPAAARSQTIEEFPLPSPSSTPRFLVAGPDGNLWFTESDGNAIGRITPAGTLAEFPLPNAGSEPWRIAAGPDGALWFTELLGNRIGRITVVGLIEEFEVPTPK